jgi:protein-tyrosine phosphatase
VIDLHTHILPDVDDGVRTEDEAVEFARAAEADGVETIVATPHCKEAVWENDLEKVLRDLEKLRSRLTAEGVAVEVLPGAEVHLCSELVERVADGRAPTLGNNGKTLLLELSLNQPPVELENLVFQLKLAGILPLFAHPERIRFFQDDVRRYESVVRLGAFGQITTGSITGLFGETAQEFSEELLRKGLVQVIASDAHNLRGRPPILRPAVAAAADLVGAEFAERMVREAPRAFLDGVEPTMPEIETRRAARGGSFLSRLFRRR